MQKIGDITNTADSNGEYTNGNVAAGIPPTILESGWFNTVQREMINVLLKAGMKPDKTNDAQLSEAIGKLVSDSQVALTDSFGQSGSLAASQKLVTHANDNANSRLDKAQNGADIEDKAAFINNLGLRDTVDRAHHSLDRRTGGEVNGDISSQGNLSVQKDISAKGKMSADDGFLAGTATLTPWGDIRGTQWGNGWLSHWLNDRLAEKPSAKFMEDSQGWWLDPTTGIILQWGKLASSGGNFNFPRAFPVECFHVFVTNNTSQGSNIDNAFGYPVNNHQFYASTKTVDGNNSGHPVAWWAIGR
ncbi:tail fiber protein [Xenorhabdus budapestensis]|uniref:Tail fiber protein n=1 Tax=Xenorhabdus budapestensis TaxID=290110 RepID=A0ABX7VN21_XENBU|nr:tail fiber protein [Xenorhabdus budapestensis]QTL38814.1 tail fiber protein [Xenorhabdus budapestensis]QTL41032.1 tail fiber protein [Xenorhabdus budapestensis]